MKKESPCKGHRTRDTRLEKIVYAPVSRLEKIYNLEEGKIIVKIEVNGRELEVADEEFIRDFESGNSSYLFIRKVSEDDKALIEPLGKEYEINGIWDKRYSLGNCECQEEDRGGGLTRDT